MSAIYRGIISVCEKFVPNKLRPLWEHPAGPKTIFFWAPVFKWGLVLAGIGDVVTRPPQNLSLSQCSSLCATAVIWSRYSLVITPVNYSLFSVNFFLAIVQAGNIGRIFLYRKSLQEEEDSKKK